MCYMASVKVILLEVMLRKAFTKESYIDMYQVFILFSSLFEFFI